LHVLAVRWGMKGCRCSWKGISIVSLVTGQFMGAGQGAVPCPCNKTCTSRERTKTSDVPLSPYMLPPNRVVERVRERDREERERE
jgi:hypothetical protein